MTLTNPRGDADAIIAKGREAFGDGWADDIEAQDPPTYTADGCSRCGATVNLNAEATHTEWHRLLNAGIHTAGKLGLTAFEVLVAIKRLLEDEASQ